MENSSKRGRGEGKREVGRMVECDTNGQKYRKKDKLIPEIVKGIKTVLKICQNKIILMNFRNNRVREIDRLNGRQKESRNTS